MDGNVSKIHIFLAYYSLPLFVISQVKCPFICKKTKRESKDQVV